MKKYKNFTKPIDHQSIILCCVLRDEILLLEYFIEYYVKIGVTHFIFIDNGSVDGSFEYLSSIEHINYMLFQSFDSYKENQFGTTWVNNVLLTYCKNCWCLVVDVDELLVVENGDLNYLRSNMINDGANVLTTMLLDMYPKDRKSKKYVKGSNFLSHSNYYDKWNNVYYKKLNHNNSHKFEIYGGVRQRVFNLKNVCLTKRSFFKFDFYDKHKTSVGYHFIVPHEDTIGLKYYGKIHMLLHFKYLRFNIVDFFKKRIKNNEDWDNSSEYKQYLKFIQKPFYNKHISVKYTSANINNSFFSNSNFVIKKTKQPLKKNIMKVLIVVISCLKNKHLWKKFYTKGTTDFIIICGKKLEKGVPFIQSNKILYLNCDDNYEGLPEKIVYMVNAILTIDRFKSYTHVLKIDDHDTHFDKRTLIKLYKMKRLISQYHYMGQKVHVNQKNQDRKWHFGKCSETSHWNNKIYEGPYTDWCDGGCGYILSKHAMTVIANKYGFDDLEKIREKHIFEDVMVGLILQEHNIKPHKISKIIVGDKV